MSWLDRVFPRAEKRAPQLQQGYYLGGSPELGPDLYLQGNDDGRNINRVYYRNVYAYQCVETIANSISGCPGRAGDPLTNNFNLLHPLARLLGPAPMPPNPMMSSANLWRYSISSYLVLGKFAWLIERNGSSIEHLWPLIANQIQPVFAGTPEALDYRARTGRPAPNGYFEFFKYGTSGQRGYMELSPDDVAYIYRPALSDPRLPESPIQPALVNIDTASLLDRFDQKFLKNGGVPAHLVVTPKFASAEDRATFQQQFQGDYGGAANAGKTMFAEREFDAEDGVGQIDSVDIKTIGTNQRDAQIPQLRQAVIQAICVAFKVPLSILGDASHRTFSNADAERRNYWLETCVPRIREIQDQINTHLAPKVGDGKALFWFDTRDVPELRKPPAIPDQVADKWVEAKIVTRDEVRADRGLPPGKDVGLDKVWEELDAQKLVPSDTGLPAQVDPDEKPVIPPATAPAAPARHAGHEGHKPVPSGHLTKSVLESVLTKQVQTLLAEQSEDAQKRMNGRRAKGGLEPFKAFDATYWNHRALMTLHPVLSELGYDERGVVAYCSDLTASTADVVERALIEGRGMTETFQEMSRRVQESRVAKSTVETTLLQLYRGNIEIDAALAQLSEVA